MIIKNVTLETVCGVTSKLPENTLPEIAFAGKSNVGKSSLINALIMRKSFARTSSEPGKTQTINFYRILQKKEPEDVSFYYVDLPGYGYAKVSMSEREKWGKLIEGYLDSSKMLKAIFLLVDIRHEPGANDRMMYDWMISRGFSPIVIATKADKIGKSKVPSSLKQIRSGLGMKNTDILIPFSAETKQGREEIWGIVEKYCIS